MSFDKNVDRAADQESARSEALAEARRLLASALGLLDAHARSQAAATVDLAIHQIDRELNA